VTFMWDAANGASSYHIMVSTSPNLSNPVLNDSTITATSRAFAGLTGGVSYYWKVRGKNGFGVGDWSDTWNFTTLLLPPAVPTLSAPAAGATDVNRNASLSWVAVSGAATYHAQIALDAGFTQVVSQDSTLTGTGFTAAIPLAASTAHYWRVSAKNAAGKGNWSGIRQFTTGVAVALMPGTPALRYSRLGGEGSLRFELAHADRVVVRLHDMRGRLVAQILNEVREAGSHRVALPRSSGQSLYLLEVRIGSRRDWIKLHP
jgi:hypothetical protein